MELPAFLPDLTFEEYLADPAPEPSLTSSIIRELLAGAPRRVWLKTPRINPQAVPEERKAFELGTAAHALFVGKGAELTIVEADSWRTKAAQMQRDDARADGRTPILAKDFDTVQAMAESAERQFGQNPNIRKLYAGAARETSIVWQQWGVHHRCRPDLFDREANVVIHYKTTAQVLSPQTLPRYAAGQGWDVTASHYRDGVKALTGEAPRQFFAVQENKPPYLAMVCQLDDIFLLCGDMVRELIAAQWARCLRQNEWPGHPVSTVRLECPPWHEAQMTTWKDEAVEKGADARRFRLTPA